MSRASKITLAVTSVAAFSTVFIVHFQKNVDQAVMHEGVVRDMEQQRIKRERQLDFDMQRELEKEYKREQTVHDALSDSNPGPPSSGSSGKSASSTR